jgi:hypothetical protein
LKGIVTHLRNGWAARQLGVLTGRLPRERTCTDQAQAHTLTENSEDLSSTVGADGVCASLGFVVSSHVA